jgi:hypothetical protein
MKQTLLRLSLPEGVRIYPNDLREMLARSNLLPPEFFGYDPDTRFPLCEAPTRADSKPTAAQAANRSAIPGVRIVGGRSWVGVLATGQANKPLLDAAIGPALQALSNRCRAPIPVQIEEHDLTIEGQEYPSAYWVREMVIKKGGSKDMDSDAHRALIKSRIETGLAKQALAYGLDCPPEHLLDVRVSDLVRPRGLRIVATSGPTGQYAQLVDVAFYANAKLRGFWFAGNMTARGYGRIGFGDYARPESRSA